MAFATFGCRLNKAEALDAEANYSAAGWEIVSLKPIGRNEKKDARGDVDIQSNDGHDAGENADDADAPSCGHGSQETI